MNTLHVNPDLNEGDIYNELVDEDAKILLLRISIRSQGTGKIISIPQWMGN
jgi:hypothetical protein